ncbi:MAG: hypothetical protein JSU86_05175 [Phycisphaerales bacterium]|nr:MAG: hypothetical protein JSU86_05175 [Phycisphaerales bacterium]
MNRITQTVVRTMLMPLISLVGLAAADDFEISRSTIDGGGAMFSTGADFELSGTVGQPDAGIMSGGDFELSGGFWFAIPLGDCEDDGDVDLFDHAGFEACVTGPAQAVDFDCRCYDVDQSGTVDLADFAVVQTTFTD